MTTHIKKSFHLELFPSALAESSGLFLEDGIYDVDQEAAKAFDNNFSPKEYISDLTSQRRFKQLLGMGKPRK